MKEKGLVVMMVIAISVIAIDLEVVYIMCVQQILRITYIV